MSTPAWRVAPLGADDAERYRALMLHAYTAAADAFTSTADERAAEPASWWAARIADPRGLSQGFGAFLGDALVGTVTVEFSAKPKRRHGAHVIGMFVHESVRGQGVGRALMQAALDAARQRPGVQTLQLELTEGNAPALALYTSCGFQAWGVEPLAIATPGGFRGKLHMWRALDRGATPAAVTTPTERCATTPDGARTVTIRPIQLTDAAGFRACLDTVARERRYLAQVEALPLERIEGFVRQSVADDAAQYVAVADGQIVGWCDVFNHWAHALQHVGTLGMGVLPAWRGQGLGERLLRATLAHALRKGITRVTLEARADNVRAIRLYERVGFRHETLARAALRFDGVYYDGVRMALLQGDAATPHHPEIACGGDPPRHQN